MLFRDVLQSGGWTFSSGHFMIGGWARPAVGGYRFASRLALLSWRRGRSPAVALAVLGVARPVRALAGSAPLSRRGPPRAPGFWGQVPGRAGGTKLHGRVVLGLGCFRPTGFY